MHRVFHSVRAIFAAAKREHKQQLEAVHDARDELFQKRVELEAKAHGDECEHCICVALSQEQGLLYGDLDVDLFNVYFESREKLHPDDCPNIRSIEGMCTRRDPNGTMIQYFLVNWCIDGDKEWCCLDTIKYSANTTSLQLRAGTIIPQYIYDEQSKTYALVG